MGRDGRGVLVARDANGPDGALRLEGMLVVSKEESRKN